MYQRSYIPRLHASLQRQPGFTLLEVLVAIVIMAVIMTTAFGALRLGGRSWEAGIQRASGNETFRAVADLLRRQVSQTIAVTWPGETGNHIAFEGTHEQIRFVAPAPQGYRQAGLFEYTLTASQEGLEIRLLLSYSPFNPGAEAFQPLPEQQQLLLVEGLENLSFDYYGSPSSGAGALPGSARQPARWYRRWDTGARNYPELVRLRMAASEGQPAWPDLYLALPAEPGQ